MAADGPYLPHVQLLTLLDGQDQAISRLKAAREEIRQTIKAGKAEGALIERRLAEDRAARDQHERARKAGELELAALGKRIDRAAQMEGVSTQKAWEAAQAEVDGLKASKARVEEVVLGAMGEIEALGEAIAAEEQALAAHADAYGRVREASKVEFDRLGEELAQATRERQGYVEELGSLDRDVLARYEGILRRHGDRAVTFAEGERCLFCRLSLIPQHLLETRMGRALHVCDHCGRFALPARPA